MAASSDEGDGGHDDAGPGGLHVQQEFLQVEEVPGRLGGVGGGVGVGAAEQGGVEEGGEEEEGDREEDGGDELDEDEVRPDEDLFLALAARAETGGGGDCELAIGC